MKSTRRSFLKSSLALPALGLNVPTLTRGTPSDSSFDPWIEVNADNLRHNVAEISGLTGKLPILAVIKNNGYGLGLTNVARILDPLPSIEGLAVIKLQEAATLCDNGIQKPILLMGAFEESELEEIVERNIIPMVYTPVGPALDRIAQKRGRQIPIHVCVDTGIGRVGIPFREAPVLVRDLASRKSARIEGIMMTFTEDKEFDREQLARFISLCNALEADGITLGKKHAVSSFGLFQHPDAFLDMVRPGMAIYGIYPEQEFRSTGSLALKPAVSLRTRVLYVKTLPRGESAGYNRVFKPEKETLVATLPVGHADGLPRLITNGGQARIGNGMYPVVAISASHNIVNLGRDSAVRAGDVATLFDWNPGSRPEDLAASFEGSVYDLTMHLNPLIPRKVL